MWPFVLVLMTGAAAVPAVGQSGDVVLGRAIAEARCAKCHAVASSRRSPHDIVIPFRDLHIRYPVNMLSEALSTHRIGGHDEMPMFDLGAEHTHALIAYIDSLNPPDKRYLAKRPQ